MIHEESEINFLADRRSAEEHKKWLCQCCNKDTLQDNKDYYMVTDAVWKAIAKDVEGMMCMDCVEESLGHKLKAEEIMMAPLSTMFNDYTRSILIEAKVPVP